MNNIGYIVTIAILAIGGIFFFFYKKGQLRESIPLWILGIFTVLAIMHFFK